MRRNVPHERELHSHVCFLESRSNSTLCLIDGVAANLFFVVKTVRGIPTIEKIMILRRRKHLIIYDQFSCSNAFRLYEQDAMEFRTVKLQIQSVCQDSAKVFLWCPRHFSQCLIDYAFISSPEHDSLLYSRL